MTIRNSLFFLYILPPWQQRADHIQAGTDGKPFIFYKFRTMKLDSDAFGASPKGGDDPRLTRIGRFLREYSLDELPQLVKIARGDMRIVLATIG